MTVAGDTVLAQPDRYGEQHAVEGEVDQGRTDHQRAQERDLPDDPQPVQHFMPQSLSGGSLLRAEPTANPAHCAERDRVGESIGQERDGAAQAEQQPAGRWAGEVGGPCPALGSGPCLHELFL
jgi:hypothetical protein